MARLKQTAQPQWSLKPFEVTRWGKSLALEPLFADERQWLMARGGPQAHVGDLVLAKPAGGNRLQVAEILGPAGDLTAVLQALLHARDIRQGFGDDVREEAREAVARAARVDAERRDVGDVPTFTIDPDGARDFDDAISVVPERDGYRATSTSPTSPTLCARARRSTGRRGGVATRCMSPPGWSPCCRRNCRRGPAPCAPGKTARR